MDRVKKVLGIALLVGLAQPLSSCCPPSTIQIAVQMLSDGCQMQLDYEGTALGIYVAGLETRFPRGNEKFPGRIYWGLDTTTFPNAIPPPVVYGEFDFPKATDTRPSGNGMDTVDKIGLPYPFPLVGTPSMSHDPRGPIATPIPAMADLTDPDDPAVPMELFSEDFSQCVEMLPNGDCPRVFQVAVLTLAGTVQIPITDFTCTPELRIYGSELVPHRG